MNILLVAATNLEISPFIAHLSDNWVQSEDGSYTQEGNKVTVLITGVGMVATTYALTRLLSRQQFDFALQAGIGGSFDRDIPLGSVVMINSEIFGDLGAEDHYDFLDLFTLGLEDRQRAPFRDGRLTMPLTPLHEKITLPAVSGLSVNSVSGSAFTALSRYKQFGCAIESMEGAAFHYVCLQEQLPFAQIRSISNYVEARDKSKWQMKDAVINLNKFLVDFFADITKG